MAVAAGDDRVVAPVERSAARRGPPAWLDVVCFADASCASIWHTPARLVRHARGHVVRILEGWPTTGEIVAAYRHIELIT